MATVWYTSAMTPLTNIINDPLRRANLEQRFWPKVSKGLDDDCWPWIAKAVHPFGYGRMTSGRGVNLKAHQISWALVNGPIPNGKIIAHRCDNPRCCNPSHLFCATMRDNTHDMISKGRWEKPPIRRGSRHALAKLEEAKIIEIRSDPRSAPVVAAEYGVCPMTIYRIRKRKAWSHV